jgi:hypothetical protein
MIDKASEIGGEDDFNLFGGKTFRRGVKRGSKSFQSGG